MSSKNSDITRRDFINGVAVGVAGAALGGLSLKEAAAAEMAGTGTSGASLRGRIPPKPYPPTGARGSDGFYGVAHEMALQWHTSWGRHKSWGTSEDAGS